MQCCFLIASVSPTNPVVVNYSSGFYFTRNHLFALETPTSVSAPGGWMWYPSLWQQPRSCWLTASGFSLHPSSASALVRAWLFITLSLAKLRFLSPQTAQTIGLQAPKNVAYQISDAFSRGRLLSVTKTTDGRRRISATGFWGRIQDPLSQTYFIRLEYLTSTSLSNGNKAAALSTQLSISWGCLTQALTG